jgi:hypothetical protein
MTKQTLPEVWLRGPVRGIPILLQPVAHALLQAREEVAQWMSGFPEDRLWERPWGVASPGFHLRHLTGVLDRLFTYARGEALTDVQLKYLASEGSPDTGSPDPAGADSSGAGLVARFNAQVDLALGQLAGTSEQALGEARGVGRSQLPSTVFGLLAHAAEHAQRHVGQLLVTTRVLRSLS